MKTENELLKEQSDGRAERAFQRIVLLSGEKIRVGYRYLVPVHSLTGQYRAYGGFEELTVVEESPSGKYVRSAEKGWADRSCFQAIEELGPIKDKTTPDHCNQCGLIAGAHHVDCPNRK